MKTVKYQKICLNCRIYSAIPNMIMWHYEDELFEYGELIFEEEMIEKIIQWHEDTNYKCESCGGTNKWDIWDVTIDDKKLKCEERKIHLILPERRIILYEFLDFADIINDLVRKHDFNLMKLKVPLIENFNRKKIAEKICTIEVIIMMETFFENVNFLPSKEIFNEALDYFRGFNDIKFNQKEFNQLKRVLQSWEQSIVQETNDENFNFLDYDPSEILTKVYPDIPITLQNEEVYKYFRLQYFNMKHHVTEEFEDIANEMKLKKNRKIIEYILKLFRSSEKLKIGKVLNTSSLSKTNNSIPQPQIIKNESFDISKNKIIEQIDSLNYLINNSPDEQSSIKFKALRIFLLWGLKKLWNVESNEFFNNQIEILDFIDFLRNPYKKQLFKDTLRMFDVEKKICYSRINSGDLPELEFIRQSKNILIMDSLSKTLHSLLNHFE